MLFGEKRRIDEIETVMECSDCLWLCVKKISMECYRITLKPFVLLWDIKNLSCVLDITCIVVNDYMKKKLF